MLQNYMSPLTSYLGMNQQQSQGGIADLMGFLNNFQQFFGQKQPFYNAQPQVQGFPTPTAPTAPTTMPVAPTTAAPMPTTASPTAPANQGIMGLRNISAMPSQAQSALTAALANGNKFGFLGTQPQGGTTGMGNRPAGPLGQSSLTGRTP